MTGAHVYTRSSRRTTLSMKKTVHKMHTRTQKNKDIKFRHNKKWTSDEAAFIKIIFDICSTKSCPRCIRCMAPGRLALTIKSWWRQCRSDRQWRNNLSWDVSFNWSESYPWNVKRIRYEKKEAGSWSQRRGREDVRDGCFREERRRGEGGGKCREFGWWIRSSWSVGVVTPVSGRPSADRRQM